MSTEPYKEYKPGDPFPGKIGRTVEESSQAWPVPIQAKPEAPNVLFYVVDDIGYGQLFLTTAGITSSGRKGDL